LDRVGPAFIFIYPEMGPDAMAAPQGSLYNGSSSYSHLSSFQFSQIVDRSQLTVLVDGLQALQSGLQAFFAAQDAAVPSQQLTDLLAIFGRC